MFLPEFFADTETPSVDGADRSDEYRLECAVLRENLPKATFEMVMVTAIAGNITPLCALDTLVKRGYKAGLMIEKLSGESEVNKWKNLK